MNPIQFDASIYTDPSMRPALKKWHEKQSNEMRASIQERPELTDPISLKLPNGEIVEAQPLSKQQYLDAVPTFEKWLEFQQNHSIFDSANIAKKMLDHAQSYASSVQSSSDKETIIEANKAVETASNFHTKQLANLSSMKNFLIEFISDRQQNQSA